MEIILARHGRPLLRDITPITGDELDAWVRRYNESGIDQERRPPDVLRRLAASAGCVLTSGLARSIESGEALTDKSEVEFELREAGLPERISSPFRMRPGLCVALARLAWRMNWGHAAETPADARARASRVAERLSGLARAHGSVLVVGHGIFNRLIAAHLRERSWIGPRTLPRAHWSVARFVQTP